VTFTKTRKRVAAELRILQCGAGSQPAAVAFTQTRKRAAAEQEQKEILQNEPIFSILVGISLLSIDLAAKGRNE